MSVLVTGGAGYIGSVAVEKLVDAGEDVVVLDDLSKGHRDAIPRHATFIQGSTHDSNLLERVFAEHDVDTVMHFAAFIEVGESCADPGRYFHNNVTGAHAVLMAMRAAGVKRFIFSSTAAVYGHPDSVPIEEDAPIRPLNPYGLSKRMVEQMLEWHHEAYGLQYVVLRYFNAAGATETRGEHHEPETHLIPNVMLAAEGKRNAVHLFGDDYPTPDGTCLRDYIHIADLISAHRLAMEHLRAGGSPDIFNLGNSVPISVMEVVDTVRKITGLDINVVKSPRRPGDSARLVASSDKARQVLGWRPERSDIETIVRDAWRWRQRHPTGYGNDLESVTESAESV